MIEKFDNFLNQKNFLIYLIILIFLSIGIIFQPAILGAWESINYYYNFAQLDPPLDFRISPRANVADPAFFFLGFSRILCDFFNFEPSISNFRFLSIVYGIISVFLFFIISKRWFGISASLISSILLTINPVFHYHQHSMTVLIISFMSFLFFLERLQTLDYRYTSNFSWFGLSLSLVLVFIHYGPGRIYAIIFLALWLIRFVYFTKNYPKSHFIIKSVFFKMGLTFLISFFLLTILDWRNLLSIIAFYNILYPSGAETIFGNLKEITFENNLLNTLFINGKILIESLTGLGNEYHSNIIANLGADFRYQLLNPFLFLLTIAGLIVCFSKLNQGHFFFSKPYLTCIVIFLVLFSSLLFSVIVFNGEKTVITLSTNRIIYLLIPSYLLISAFLDFIFKKLKNKKIYSMFCLAALFVFYIASINSLNKNYKDFNNKLNSVNYKISGSDSYAQWSDGTYYSNNKVNSFGHNQLHSQYYNTAKKTKKKLDITENNNYYILNVDTKQFSEIPPHYLESFNYHSIFFSLYLNSIGVKSAWIQMIDIDEPPRDLVRYTSGKFSAPFVIKNSEMQYIKSQGFQGYLRYSTNMIPNVIVSTTKEELNFASNFLEKNNFNFIIINI